MAHVPQAVSCPRPNSASTAFTAVRRHHACHATVVPARPRSARRSSRNRRSESLPMQDPPGLAVTVRHRGSADRSCPAGPAIPGRPARATSSRTLSPPPTTSATTPGTRPAPWRRRVASTQRLVGCANDRFDAPWFGSATSAVSHIPRERQRCSPVPEMDTHSQPASARSSLGTRGNRQFHWARLAANTARLAGLEIS